MPKIISGINPGYWVIVIMLAIWAAFAGLATFIYPDSAMDSLSVFRAYMTYALNNGLLFVMVLGAIGVAKFVLGSGSQPMSEYLGSMAGRLKTADYGSILKRIAGVICGLVLFVVFISVYTIIKARIQVMVPFRWDELFASLDRAIFLGHDPWRLMAGLFDYPAVVKFVDTLYDMWAALLVTSWLFVFASRKDSEWPAVQYGIALLLVWFIGGNLLAVLLSSAGPCYFEAVTGTAETFGPQLTLLDNMENLRVRNYQELLWERYNADGYGLSGISAMPSMHCATSFLMMVSCYKRKRWLFWLFALIFAIIFIGSVLLAWHYAVDGLLAIPIVLVCWKIAGWLAARSQARI